ncbi:MAG: hypothetical protein ACJARL_001291 [Halopseudomonas sp.]|jgi:hypothetical protein
MLSAGGPEDSGGASEEELDEEEPPKQPDRLIESNKATGMRVNLPPGTIVGRALNID